jgi:ABC-type branched-subunit amino acid transport system ATPase component
LGRNGAGKSTFLKSIMNAGPIVRGTVILDSRPLANLRACDRVGLGVALVPEDRRIFGHLTVLDNLLLAQYSAPKGAVLPSVDQLMDRFPMLRPLKDRLGSQMSGGQQQMLAIARAIAAKPRLMLLDEPTEGLAPVIVEQLAAQVVASCEAYGISLLLAEQSIWFARQCTDNVVIIDTGEIVFRGDWKAFDDAASLVQRYLAV